MFEETNAFSGGNENWNMFSYDLLISIVVIIFCWTIKCDKNNNDNVECYYGMAIALQAVEAKSVS